MEATGVVPRGYRLIAGALAIFAVVGQYVVSRDVPGFTAANYLSYFTIESNVLIGVLLLALAVRPDVTGRWDGVRGAFTLYIVITGIVYNALLRGTNVDVTNPLYNEILHLVLPVVALVDWVLVAPRRPVTRAGSTAFLLYPVAYFGYSLLRGAVTNWYPYPFLNPTLEGGYARVAIYAIVLIMAMMLLALGVAELGRLAAGRAPGRRRDRDIRSG